MIDGKTSLVGVVGCPVQHSLSPAIHNAALSALNLNWCYLAIPCKAENFKLVVESLRNIDCKGLNITIPHKNKALEICNVISPIAKEIGSVNTLIPDPNGGWNGANTDIEGFLAPLKIKKDWSNKNALIIGCGGSAKSVFHGLQNLKFSKVTIVSRSKDSLNNFLSTVQINNKLETEIESLTMEDLSIAQCIKNAELIVNATPIGMYDNLNDQKSLEIPLGKDIWKNLEPGTTLYDLIYTPRPTEWLKLSKLYSCQQIDGLEMLIQQGASSLKLWTGIEEIPINVMRKAAQISLMK